MKPPRKLLLGATPAETIAAVNTLIDILSGQASFEDNLLGAPISLTGMTSGTERELRPPSGFRPSGFIPKAAYNADGAALLITAYKFNPSPSTAGWIGITVDVASGTLDRVDGWIV